MCAWLLIAIFVHKTGVEVLDARAEFLKEFRLGQECATEVGGAFDLAKSRASNHAHTSGLQHCHAVKLIGLLASSVGSSNSLLGQTNLGEQVHGAISGVASATFETVKSLFKDRGTFD